MFGEKLRASRIKAGMTQEELARVLMVSRQAVTKWESNKGMPDIENLNRIAKALAVSIDYLLDEGGDMDFSCTKEPIKLEDYSNYNNTSTKRLLKKDKWCDEAVRAKFPEAKINYLLHKQTMNKVEKGLQAAFWLTTPIANIVEILQSFQNKDKHFYLVTENEKQYLVLITDEFMEIRHLTKTIDKIKIGKKFEIGEFQFTCSVEI